METSATVVNVNGTTRRLRRRPTLKEAQEIVGGYIELVKATDLSGKPVVLIVCEDGKILHMLNNSHISKNYGPSIHNYSILDGSIVGNVIVLRGYQTVG